MSHLESKTSNFLAINPPNTLKLILSSPGSLHYISKNIPNLAQFCHPLRPVLRKKKEIQII